VLRSEKVKDCLSPILAKKQNVLVLGLSHRNINVNFLGKKPLRYTEILMFLASHVLQQPQYEGCPSRN
jgi:hypothetical protein